MSDQTNQITPPFYLISFEDLQRMGWPFTRAWTMKYVRAGTFPAPVKLSARTVRWRSDEIDRWMESLPPGMAVRRGKPATH
jgi:predicted DNA-binding transcriptional regulator AlpA